MTYESFLQKYPANEEVPENLKSDTTLKVHQPHLNKLVAPFFKECKEAFEKAAAKWIHCQKLRTHVSEKTFPPEIPPMRRPQMGKEHRESFNLKYDDINLRARTELLKTLLQFREQEHTTIDNEKDAIVEKIENAIDKYSQEVFSMLAIANDIVRVYKCQISKRISNLYEQVRAKRDAEWFQTKQKRAEQAEADARMDIEPGEAADQSSNDALAKLQKQFSVMQKSLKKVNKKLEEGGKPKPKQQNSPNAPKKQTPNANGKQAPKKMKKKGPQDPKPNAKKGKGKGAGGGRAAAQN